MLGLLALRPVWRKLEFERFFLMVTEGVARAAQPSAARCDSRLCKFRERRSRERAATSTGIRVVSASVSSLAAGLAISQRHESELVRVCLHVSAAARFTRRIARDPLIAGKDGLDQSVPGWQIGNAKKPSTW